MTSIESQLLEYRANKARERKPVRIPPGATGVASSPSSRVTSWWSVMGILDYFRKDQGPGDGDTEQLIPELATSKNANQKINQKDHRLECPEDEDDKLISRNCIIACSTESPIKDRIIAAVPIILKLTLWTILWALFIEIGFGAVYFVVSLLILMYFSMRTRPRKAGEMSAYSVFNPGQEKLDGTFTAEQFEKELRFGAGAFGAGGFGHH